MLSQSEHYSFGAAAGKAQTS